MHHLRAALESTSSHGLPRLVTSKPIYVRIAWLLIFGVTLSLFLRGFIEFVGKLQLNPASNHLEVNSVDFRFPDVYTCFENPISGSYSANVDAASAAAINHQINKTMSKIVEFASILSEDPGKYARFFSFVQPYSLQYQLLVDTLGKRLEQSIISGGLMTKESTGMPNYTAMSASSFYHPVHLRCAKWVIDSTQAERLRRSGTSSGLLLKVLLDGNSSFIPAKGVPISEAVYVSDSPMPVSEWSLSSADTLASDRASGLRVYLTPPGEYPSDFATSFSISPGKFHTVEIGMTQLVYKAGQFECQSDIPDVQFVNPYDKTPYKHSYSYSYCFYYEYQNLYQTSLNLSGDATPIPWALSGKEYAFNVTSTPNLFTVLQNTSEHYKLTDIQQHATTACKPKRPCSTFKYSVSISSSDWPTEGSLTPLINDTIVAAWLQAKAMNLSTPALDFLFHGSDYHVVSYVQKNLLKVFFKPKSLQCDKISFSRDYGASNFISDVGGIMGIYLGMSILTLCEVFELIYDLVTYFNSRKKTSKGSAVAAVTTEVSATTSY